MAGGLARLPAHAQGPSRHLGEEREKSDGTATAQMWERNPGGGVSRGASKSPSDITIEIRRFPARRGSRETRRPTNGPSSRRKCQTPAGWGGWFVRTGRGRARCRSPDPLFISSDRAGGRTSKKKYRMPSSQKPDGVVAGSPKRFASRFYQVKTGHCLSGQYLQWTKNRPTAQCRGCRCQAPLRGVSRVEAPAEDPVGRGTEWKREGKSLVHDPGPPCRHDVQPGTQLPLYNGCGKAGFGPGCGGRAGREDSGSGRSGRRGMRSGGRRPRVKNYRCYSLSPLRHGGRWRGVGTSHDFFCSFLSLSFAASLVRIIPALDRPGQRAKGSLQRGLRTRNLDVMCATIVYIGCTRV